MGKDKKVLRCIHRHTIKEHPNCFRKGLIKREDWWHDKTIAYLDIETADLNANWGFMLSWCIKYRDDDKIRKSIIKKKEIFDYEFDERLVKELLEELKNVDIVVTYYGTRFDIPFIRSRAMFWGMDDDFPAYGDKYHWDLYYKVRSKFKLHSNKLSVACAFLGIEGKTPLTSDLVMMAQYAHPKALKTMMEHNIGDVEILEKLHNKLWRHSKWIRKSI